MSLNKLVAEATEAHDDGVVIDRHGAIKDILPKVMADKEMTETCVRSHVSKMIASNVRKRKRRQADGMSGQMSFFGLDDTHVLDEGQGQIKHTRSLSRIEFASLIRVRDDQVKADLAYLHRLRTAQTATRDIWDRHPDWMWGQVEDAYARQQQAA